MNNKLSEEILRDLILEELNLPEIYGFSQEGHPIPSVYVWFPDIYMGATEKLQVSIRCLNANIISNQEREISDGTGLREVKEIITNDLLQVDIMSANNEALDRRYEIIAALKSTAAQQMQDAEQVKIFNIPQRLVNVSSIEGASRIHRYVATITVQNKFIYEKDIDYYNQFNVQINADNLDHPNNLNFE